MIDELNVGVLTPKQFTLREDTSKALDLICSVYPDLTPHYYGNYEPLRSPFDLSRREDFLDALDQTVFFKRRKPKVEGTIQVAYPKQKIHATLNMNAETKGIDLEGLIRFVQHASPQLYADFAYLHLPTEPEVPTFGITNTGGWLDRKKGTYLMCPTGHTLKKYIPELYWATVLGPAYIKHFGRDHIMSTPAPVVHELDGRCIYIQLSESPFDFKTDFERVDAVRQAAKRHLNKDSFFDISAPDGHIYNVPEFKLELGVSESSERL